MSEFPKFCPYCGYGYNENVYCKCRKCGPGLNEFDTDRIRLKKEMIEDERRKDRNKRKRMRRNRRVNNGR